MEETLKKEYKRKSLHLIALIIPFGIYFIPDKIAITILFATTIIFFIVDIARLKLSQVKRIFLYFFSPLIRDHEHNYLTGSTFLLLASSLCTLIFLDFETLKISHFEKLSLFYAFSISIVGDASAAIFGKKYGKRKLFKSKTIIGTFAYFVTGILISLIYSFFLNSPIPIIIAISASAIMAILETLPLDIDDNLVAAPPACFFMYYLMTTGIF